VSGVQSLKRLVPAEWRPPIRNAWTRLRHLGWRRRCNICGAVLRAFLAHGIPPEPDFLCPSCRSKPPHRLAAIYFDRHPGLFVRDGLLVHVAPELGLGPWLQKRAQARGMRYRAGGISGSGENYLDLRQLPFTDGSVDLVYCCHVLNCMEEDQAAMREVRRVLSPSGVAILQVPAFEAGPATVETSGPADRLRVFADQGIFRRYTNEDFSRRLRAAGFSVAEYRADSLPADERARQQLKFEHLHVCQPL
jgi:SAM-dependent methyltransferase